MSNADRLLRGSFSLRTAGPRQQIWSGFPQGAVAAWLLCGKMGEILCDLNPRLLAHQHVISHSYHIMLYYIIMSSLSQEPVTGNLFSSK